jgi:plasmid stability protein
MAELTIAVPDELVRQAQRRALQEGSSLQAKIEEMLVDYVAGEGPPSGAAHAAVPPNWVQRLRSAVDEFGGIDDEEWKRLIPPRGAGPQRPPPDFGETR